MSKRAPNTSKNSAPAAEAEAQDGESPSGRFGLPAPLPPWWILLLSILLLPIALIGGMFFVAGWLIGQRWRSVDLAPPQDAQILMKFGQLGIQALFWPTLFYFSKTSKTKHAVFKAALWTGGKGVRALGSKASSTLKRALGTDDEAPKDKGDPR